MTITHSKNNDVRRQLFSVTLITESGHVVTDTLTAYNTDDAKNRARTMMRANHNESYARILTVTEISK